MDNKDFWEDGKHLWITSKDMKSQCLNDSQMRISDTAVQEMTVFHPGTILMVNRSGILRRTLPLAILAADATINQDIKAIVPYLLCLSSYLYYAILAQESFILSEYKKAGTTVDNINFDKFISLLIPLPPQKEQDRIVSSLNQCFAIIESIDSGQKDLEISLDAAKAKILDLAIHGKLVPQDSNEEPAIELLRRITPTSQPSHNLHYCSMPRGWCECRLQDCVEILNGYAFKSNEYTGEGIRVIRITNVQSGTISDEDPKFFPAQRSHEIDRYLLKEGDLLISLTGNVGRVAFLEKSMLPAALNQRVACLRSPLPSEVLMFIFYFCQTKEFANACVSSGKGVAQLNISTEWLKDYRISLPPINEIRRIIKAVRKHLILLEEIANI